MFAVPVLSLVNIRCKAVGFTRVLVRFAPSFLLTPIGHRIAASAGRIDIYPLSPPQREIPPGAVMYGEFTHRTINMTLQ